jgi:hypothetical protein
MHRDFSLLFNSTPTQGNSFHTTTKLSKKVPILRNALLWVITQRVVEISYRRFGTTYRSCLQGSRFQSQYGVHTGKSVTPEDETGSRPETSVRNNHYSRNDPEERSSHLLRGGSLKSCTDFNTVLRQPADRLIERCSRYRTLSAEAAPTASSYSQTP